MSFKDRITKGITERPVKCVIYGVEGIGKTTFASQFPKPLFLDLDRGSALLDVDRVNTIHTWTDLIETVKSFIQSAGDDYHTLVIDTADAAASLCERYVIKTQAGGKSSIEAIPYGKGYKMLAEQFANLMVWLEYAIDQGFNVVLVAHARLKTITKPDDMGAYDHWELKLPGNGGNQLSPLIKEWADLLLFADYKTRLVGDANGKKKAIGGERIMYTSHTPFADAKNRFGLDEVLTFEYKQIAKVVPEKKIIMKEEAPETATPKSEKPKKQAKTSSKEKEPTADELAAKLVSMAKEVDIPPEDIMKAIGKMGDFKSDTPINEYGEEYLKSLINQWESFKAYIQQEIQGYPF